MFIAWFPVVRISLSGTFGAERAFPAIKPFQIVCLFQRRKRRAIAKIAEIFFDRGPCFAL
jgi:hypothetical protein